jgi:hypothetical protein
MVPPDDERADELWPDVPRVSFGPGDPAYLNANLELKGGSREADLQAYILGYSRAAQALFEHSTSCTRISADYLIFPLAYLWRHYVELALKQIIVLGKRFNQEPPSSTTSSHLLDLWKAAKPYIVEHCSEDVPEMSNVQTNIEEIERLDRYVTSALRQQFGNEVMAGPPHAPQQINLRVLQQAMLALSNFFDAVHTCQSIALETKD